MSAAPSPCTTPSSRRPGRLPWAGTVSRWPASRTSGRSPRAVVPARTQVSPASRASTPAERSSASTDAASAASWRDSEGASTSSSVRAARRSARSSAIRPAMLAGDALLRRGRLGEARQPAARDAPRAAGPRRRGRARGHVLRAGRRRRDRADGPRVRRRGRRRRRRAVRAAAGPARPGQPAARAPRAPRGPLRALARLRRDPLPPRAAAVPGARRRSGARALGGLDGGRLRPLRRPGAARPLPAGEPSVAPDPPAVEAPVGDGALRFGRLFETYPDAVFCALLGHRPPAKRTPWGLQQRIAALRLRGVVDEDGGLWHRTLDELDACAAALAAHALATGPACWVGDPREGVIVLPGDGLLERYAKLPPPRRQALA